MGGGGLHLGMAAKKATYNNFFGNFSSEVPSVTPVTLKGY